MDPEIFHPNVYEGGRIDLKLSYPKQWKKETSIATILLAIQHMLANSKGGRAVANLRAYNIKRFEPERYKKFVLESVEENQPDATQQGLRMTLTMSITQALACTGEVLERADEAGNGDKTRATNANEIIDVDVDSDGQ